MTQAHGLAHSRQHLLLAEAKRLGILHDLLLRRYAFERFLVRLGESSHRNAFVLKGAMALIAVTGAFNRPTRDMDILGLEVLSDEEALQTLIEIASTEPSEPDGITFDFSSFAAETINAAAEEPGTRITGYAYLQNVRIPLKIEIAHGHLVTPEPVDMEYPTVLGGTLPASILCYTKETMLAEKFEALCALGANTSRFKDFYDIRELIRKLEFNGSTVSEAVRRTFTHRGTAIPELPPAPLLPDFFDKGDRGWKSYLRKQGIKDDQPYEDVVAEIEPFLMKVAEMARNGSAEHDWSPGQGWSPTVLAPSR